MRLRLPVERNLVGVVRKSLFVRVVVVVQFGREIDEHRRLVADGFEPVPARARDADDLVIVFADDERVQLALSGGVFTIVVDADLDAAIRAGEVIDLALKMAVPCSDDARVGERIVGHGWLGVEDVPVLAVGFDEVAPFIGVDLKVADFDVVDLGHLLRRFRPDGLVLDMTVLKRK